MDSETLVFAMDFARSRLLGILATIEKTAAERGIPVQQILAWRPAPGRAHIGWQAIHCAATHDKYLNVNLLGKAVPRDAALLANFGGGTTPSDEKVPDLATIRQALESAYTPFRDYVSGLDAPALAKTIPGPNNTQRTIAEAITLLTWHEAHHQGQIHLTWNLYKAANGF
jgi:hypothetical protein